jgi:hypothetical protein
MSRKPGTMALVLILVATALNISILIFNLSLPSRAAVAGMDYQALMSDSDFKQAVQSVVQCQRSFGQGPLLKRPCSSRAVGRKGCQHDPVRWPSG